MKMLSLFVVAAMLVPTAAHAQSCATPPAPPNGTAGSPFFEFQTDKAARYVRADSLLPMPDPSRRAMQPFPPDFALAQFVVDTAGVPVARTLKLLVTPDGVTQAQVATALERWRYEPATVQGCRVSQLVQTPLRWK
ncbi:MAG: hypothetical protein V4617_17060 [Gemmatimonadota bacterium]